MLSHESVCNDCAAMCALIVWMRVPWRLGRVRGAPWWFSVVGILLAHIIDVGAIDLAVVAFARHCARVGPALTPPAAGLLALGRWRHRDHGHCATCIALAARVAFVSCIACDAARASLTIIASLALFASAR